MAKDSKVTEPKKQEVLQQKEELALDDARRVKVLSPGMLVFKRFIRNKLAVLGIIILVFMFLFAFVGPLFTPYEIAQVFFSEDERLGDYATGNFVKDAIFYPGGNSALNTAVFKALGEKKDASGNYVLTVGEEIPFTAGKDHYTLKVINPDPKKPSCAIYGTVHIATAVRGEVGWYDETYVDDVLLTAIRENAAQDKPGTELAYNGTTISIESKKVETKYFAPANEPTAVSSYSSYSPLSGRVSALQADTVFLKNVASAIKSGETSVTREGETYTIGGDVMNDFTLSASDGTKLFDIVREFHSLTIKSKEKNDEGAEIEVDKDFLTLITDAEGFKTAIKTAIKDNSSDFTFEDKSFKIEEIENDYLVSYENQPAISVVTSFNRVATKYDTLCSDFNFIYALKSAEAESSNTFEYDGETYTISKADNTTSIQNAAGDDVVLASNIIYGSTKFELTEDFSTKLRDAMNNQNKEFTFVDQYGKETDAVIEIVNENYYVKTMQTHNVFDRCAPPTLKHPVGTEVNGMDVLTRLMYGGRVSLIVGFVVVFFEIIIGVVVGGISGYFGGVVDTILMRFVELFNAIPFYPMLMILGAIMDSFSVSPTTRLFLTMVILGILGWTGIARIVRGQILSLREQDFMVATEATGIRTSRRIFKHLVPNVMPLLIVNATSALGSTILTEATLGFLGLGVKYPMASWGSIVNQATDMHIMSTAPWIWIPAGILILLTVLGFNFVGDGLRDAFDPKMKR
ncbi:MAG: ABC transporter permease [Clostridia bacterium]|nr:ABC transporter permease [Clostridia bacterium]